MKKYQMQRTVTITPALLVTDDAGTSVAPLIISRFLLPILYCHQWLMVNYYAVIKLRRITAVILRGLWREATRPISEAAGVIMAGIIIKSVWWGMT